MDVIVWITSKGAIAKRFMDQFTKSFAKNVDKASHIGINSTTI